MNFVNPKSIPANDLPLIVFYDNPSGIIESLITIWTKGEWNHAMWLHRPGYFATQGNTYKEVPINKYMRKNGRLKFWEIIGLNIQQKGLILTSIAQKLKKPWWRKMYDWLGILGQLLKVEWFNNPALDYCSEDVVQHLRLLEASLSNENHLKTAFVRIPKHTNPSKLNEYFKEYPDCFRVYGWWDSDGER